jgi:hypothetical protein
VTATSRVFVPFAQPEIYDEDLILGLPLAYQKVVRFYVPMKKAALMDVLNPLKHLYSNH